MYIQQKTSPGVATRTQSWTVPLELGCLSRHLHPFVADFFWVHLDERGYAFACSCTQQLILLHQPNDGTQRASQTPSQNVQTFGLKVHNFVLNSVTGSRQIAVFRYSYVLEPVLQCVWCTSAHGCIGFRALLHPKSSEVKRWKSPKRVKVLSHQFKSSQVKSSQSKSVCLEVHAVSQLDGLIVARSDLVLLTSRMPASATSLVTCELVLVASCFRFVLSHAAHFLSSQTATESDALACGDQMLQKHLRTHASASSLMSGRGKGPKAAQSLAQHSSRVTAGEGHCIRSHCPALSPASQVKVLSLHPFSFFCVCESPLTPLTHSLTHSHCHHACMHSHHSHVCPRRLSWSTSLDHRTAHLPLKLGVAAQQCGRVPVRNKRTLARGTRCCAGSAPL
jgi:hypothetical protein